MKLTVISFGQIANITGNNFVLEENLENTDDLKGILRQRFPALNDMKFAIAIDKKMASKNTGLAEHNTIALLPPFSGG